MPLIFGEADPRDFTLPAYAEEQTKGVVAADATATKAEVAFNATLVLGFEKYPRKECDYCEIRRVRYAITANGTPVSRKLCAWCAGLR
jgi:hypothetical protein